MRLIDADKLVARVMQIRKTDVSNGVLAGWCLDTILRFVDEATTVEPKRGYWITWFEDEDVRQAKCSECGMMFTLGKGREIHYCGNCGAKMEVEE